MSSKRAPFFVYIPSTRTDANFRLSLAHEIIIMAKEIERKFLVRKDLWYALHKPEGIEITQAYLHNQEGRIIRIRIAGNKAYITIKSPTIEFTRDEFEYEIPVADAQEILSIFQVKKLEKVRYKLELLGHLWEVDEFFGENEGLVMAEVELKSQDEHVEYPSWLSEEVTFDHRYYNSYLINNPYSCW